MLKEFEIWSKISHWFFKEKLKNWEYLNKTFDLISNGAITIWIILKICIHDIRQRNAINLHQNSIIIIMKISVEQACFGALLDRLIKYYNSQLPLQSLHVWHRNKSRHMLLMLSCAGFHMEEMINEEIIRRKFLN